MGRRTHNSGVMLKASVDGKEKTKLYGVSSKFLSCNAGKTSMVKDQYVLVCFS